MSKFRTNCTLPPDIVNYVSTPNTRGTVDILLTCFATILLCTWSIQHPNITAYKTARGWKDDVRKVLKQVKLMVLTIFVPEYLLLLAFGELSSAISLKKQFGSVARKDGAEWSLVHSFFANMGGFVILFNEETPTAPTEKPESPESSSITKTLENQTSETTTGENITSNPESFDPSDAEKGMRNTKAKADTSSTKSKRLKSSQKAPKQTPSKRISRILSVADRHCKAQTDKNSLLVEEIILDLKHISLTGDEVSDGFAGLADIVYNLVRLRGDYWALDGAQILLARELGIICQIPNITSKEIDDIAKGDVLAKLLAIIHVTWQIVQLAKRKAENLPSSQLEVVTVAFSVCAFCTYLLYWNKPQNIAVPRFVKANRCPTKDEVLELARAGPAYVTGIFPGDDYSMPGHSVHQEMKGARQRLTGGVLGWSGSLLGGMLFGLLHCAAWNYHFPTAVEGLLWKIAAVVTAAWPLIYGARAFVVPPYESDGKRRKDGLGKKIDGYISAVSGVLGTLLASVYALARLYLLVETFRALFFLLPATFKSS